MKTQLASDIDSLVSDVVKKLNMTYIHPNRIICVRSTEAVSRARARIWSFPKIWQMALHKPSCYIIEVLSQHFDHLLQEEKIRIIIHELMHIPKNFSGALIPHRGIHKKINKRTVEQLFEQYRLHT